VYEHLVYPVYPVCFIVIFSEISVFSVAKSKGPLANKLTSRLASDWAGSEGFLELRGDIFDVLLLFVRK
jgi:hypothetical protein